MKNIIKGARLALCLAVFLSGISCQKDKKEETQDLDSSFNIQSNIDYSKIAIISKGFRGNNGSSQMLHFKDIKSVKQTISELERQVKDLDHAFVKKYSNLDEEAINVKEDEIKFNEEKPLLDFNKQLNFKSLYKKISTEEEEWLRQDELDFDNDPDNHFILEDEVRAILNTDAELMIGDKIYKYNKDGYFEIANGSLKILAELSNGVSNYFSLPNNVKFVGDDGSRGDGCNSNKRNSDKKDDGDKRMKWVVSHWTHVWGRRVAAKVDNYKKRKWSGWKKYRTYCVAKVYGHISDSDGDCDAQAAFNPGNVYYEYENSAKHVEHKIVVSTKTKSGWVKAIFEGAGGITYSKTLTW